MDIFTVRVRAYYMVSKGYTSLSHKTTWLQDDGQIVFDFGRHEIIKYTYLEGLTELAHAVSRNRSRAT